MKATCLRAYRCGGRTEARAALHRSPFQKNSNFFFKFHGIRKSMMPMMVPSPSSATKGPWRFGLSNAIWRTRLHRTGIGSVLVEPVLLVAETQLFAESLCDAGFLCTEDLCTSLIIMLVFEARLVLVGPKTCLSPSALRVTFVAPPIMGFATGPRLKFRPSITRGRFSFRRARSIE